MKILVFVCLSLALVYADEVDIAKFIASSNDFTSSVYNELIVDNKENLLVSPFSVETILALTQTGAVGDTGAEIRSTLMLPETKDETDSLMKNVLTTFHGKEFELHTANKVYVENKFPIQDDFKKLAADDYEASFQNIEFADSTEAAEEINTWVEEETNGKIGDLIQPGDVDENTKIVLVNALYFQANWSSPFTVDDTNKAAFFTSEEESTKTDFMYKESIQLNYANSEEDDAQIIELPLGYGEATMVIYLPNKKEGIALLEKKSVPSLANIGFSKKFVEVSLPKFKIESSIDFTSVLLDLGVKKAFGSDADFSGIAGSPGDLVLGEVHQKTYISVNEGGVEAAAATEIAIPTDVIPDAEEVFIADHPFMFSIQVNGIVLFIGRVLVPEYDE